MAKTAALSIRIDEEVKKALEKAAEQEERSIASYVERLLKSHLKEKGYLPK
ncbi:ribbon-helix-helix protein, CopG family [Rhizobium sp. 1399]|jgi:hypothetical protein|uniref:ribbon-helix-helix protein, CopG family n=1 Tax=unclassified Rhizobium TaxID=2613769 RepID=UPI00285C53F1|nr:ribbon-helix-helix protein, CopG family [Rhizobium sp. 1399]MDR6667238.1 hypothetical protein [Rhizobium sp. 1399]